MPELKYTPYVFRAVAESALATFGPYQSPSHLTSHPRWDEWCEGWAKAVGATSAEGFGFMVRNNMIPEALIGAKTRLDAKRIQALAAALEAGWVQGNQLPGA